MSLAAPHSVEAEQGVLGSMLLSPREVIPECIEKIQRALIFISSGTPDNLLGVSRALERRPGDRSDYSHANIAGPPSA
jgi:replicative DNA helicase